MLLLRNRSMVRTGDKVCFELVNEGSRDDVKVDFLNVAKALLKVCKDVQVNLLTSISRSGYKSLVILSSERDVMSCKNIFKALLMAYMPDYVKVNEIICNDKAVDEVPF
ncbi:MAG: hypothetical protein QXH57_04380 [Sulfolobales archaeon]